MPVTTHFTKRGTKYLRDGELERAARAFRRAIEADPRDTDAYTALSAIQRKQGNRGRARRTLRRGIECMPYAIRPCEAQPLARVLRVRGVQNAYYMLVRSSKYKYKKNLRGGNFTAKYLIDEEKYTVINFSVMNDNILHYEDMPSFDVILNSIADPDVEADSLRAVSRFIQRDQARPVINRPAYVMRTTRDDNYRRLKDVEGIFFPKTMRVAARTLEGGQADRFVEENGFSFPVLVRATGTHTGRTFARVETRREFADYVAGSRSPELYVTQYVESLFAGDYFRKLRVFFIDGRMYPVVCHIDVKWNVHGDDRKNIMLGHDWMMDEERSFMSNPRQYLGADRYEVLQGLYDANPLDFFGVDFTIRDDGTVFIYELNPAMRHSFDHARTFAYLTPYMEDVTNAFNAMIARKAGIDAAGADIEAGFPRPAGSQIESAA